ncbi:hypothetical protein HBH98_218080 [Parastagonospora nodorum]|nr:hypothetical protein HBH53_086740 [Parastagonospora nodorum]KAH4066966.1 hypothetical protein HBH50_145380 [Parastagonospora nodorum]KAH4085969.1 hypothetical protein HBH48_144490 [Parastagonospora nodorum]KAH4169620.1 hypothetical protein HBH43_108550 [Parastagonospora nodorum]KAH4189407.1 hypothetical protein HBH42_143300 [Parastagonospora nodorum]
MSGNETALRSPTMACPSSTCRVEQCLGRQQCAAQSQFVPETDRCSEEGPNRSIAGSVMEYSVDPSSSTRQAKLNVTRVRLRPYTGLIQISFQTARDRAHICRPVGYDCKREHELNFSTWLGSALAGAETTRCQITRLNSSPKPRSSLLPKSGYGNNYI